MRWILRAALATLVVGALAAGPVTLAASHSSPATLTSARQSQTGPNGQSGANVQSGLNVQSGAQTPGTGPDSTAAHGSESGH